MFNNLQKCIFIIYYYYISMRNCFYFILPRNQFIAKYLSKSFLRIENIIAVKL
jgi:hypothetical protein